MWSSPYKAKRVGNEQLGREWMPMPGTVALDDKVAGIKGLSVYDEMLRDAEVSAALSLKLVGMMPGLQILPAGETDEAKRSRDFIAGILEALDGSLLGLFRDQILREGLSKGFAIAELVQTGTDLPEFGRVKGLAKIKLTPSQDYADCINADEYGNIESIEQGSGGATVPMDSAVYWVYNGTPANPYGRSILYAAYDAWKLKQHTFRAYAMYLDANAGGRRIGSIPEKQFEAWKDQLETVLKRQSSGSTIIKPDFIGLDIQEPTGVSGTHFISAIRELCNKEIRKAVLGDEAINAEGLHTGSYASRKVSQQTVHEISAAEGWAFCEVLTKQVSRRLLRWNGYSWPAPRFAPEPQMTEEDNLADNLKALSTAVRLGAITEPIPPEAQKQVIDQLLSSAGIRLSKDVTAPGEREDEEPVQAAAGAPPGRRSSDVRKIGRKLDKLDSKAAACFKQRWEDEVFPAVYKSLQRRLFDAKGNWKTTQLSALRNEVEKAVTAKGKVMREALTEQLAEGFAEGEGDAEKIVPRRKASVNVTSMRISPSKAKQILGNRVYMLLQKRYTDLAEAIYLQLESALTGNIPEQRAASRIAEILRDRGLGRYATTIVGTSMSTAYNLGRQSIFAGLEDPTGEAVGGIIGYEHSSILDNVTTDICEERHGRFFRVDDPELMHPPLHHNCRSVLIPVFAGEEPWGGGKWRTSQDEPLPPPAEGFAG